MNIDVTHDNAVADIQCWIFTQFLATYNIVDMLPIYWFDPCDLSKIIVSIGKDEFVYKGIGCSHIHSHGYRCGRIRVRGNPLWIEYRVNSYRTMINGINVPENRSPSSKAKLLELEQEKLSRSNTSTAIQFLLGFIAPFLTMAFSWWMILIIIKPTGWESIGYATVVLWIFPLTALVLGIYGLVTNRKPLFAGSCLSFCLGFIPFLSF